MLPFDGESAEGIIPPLTGRTNGVAVDPVGGPQAMHYDVQAADQVWLPVLQLYAVPCDEKFVSSR